MPALPADIGRALRRAVIVEASNPALKAVYGQARDARTAPNTGYFDDEDDGQDALDARLALIGVVRRRFAAPVADVIFPDLSGGVPVWTLIDAENDVNGKHLTARLEMDAESETTTMELFG
jgi:hypothetical protein